MCFLPAYGCLIVVLAYDTDVGVGLKEQYPRKEFPLERKNHVFCYQKWGLLLLFLTQSSF